MGYKNLMAHCNACNEEFGVDIAERSKESAIEAIKAAYCPSCESDNWHFLDYMEAV